MLGDYAHHLLEQVRDLALLIDGNKIPVIETLKKLPRTGKSVRLKKFGIGLPFRSVYDHILSLPQQAEFFLKLTNAPIDPHRLAAMLIFHDLAEAIIGDIPCYIPQELAQETYLTPEEKEAAERRVNNLLHDALPQELKDLFSYYVLQEQHKVSPVYRFFYMIDKTDSIIAIWRYLSLFREKIEIDPFLSAMSDFFVYPETQRACVDKQVLGLVRTLQNRENAKQYFLNNFSHETVEHLVENRQMHLTFE